MSSGLNRGVLYLVFGLSGFSGLVYESVWSHYLKLFLGHAAYAQALVLVIFMGGMALGAWLASRHGRRTGNLLLAYAVVEGIIGLMGVVFHAVYLALADVSFGHVIPLLGAPLYVDAYKVTAASLLILPQSVLLGATFPMMSGGFLRRFPAAPGRSIAMLYFTNSLGAALALLISSFYLIGKLGLPGTMLTAGLINIGVALVVYLLARDLRMSAAPEAAGTGVRTGRAAWFLAAAFFTGLASFIYEVAWIRMLSMVLGSSTHSFELMLSAFITGLAIGGWWIRGRIDSLKDPVGFAGLVQILMGLLAFATIFLYRYSFDLMHFLMVALEKSDQGYALYSVASHAIALVIMLPATICAGMTLPLFTSILLREGHGEKSIGQIYASNTLGAIFGVLFAVFIGMPLLGLKGALLTGTLIDIAIGIALLLAFPGLYRMRRPARYAVLFMLIFIFTAFFYQFDTRRMASGVFRSGMAELRGDTEVLYHADGRTASVTVTEWNDDRIAIATNGKVDAAISMAGDTLPTTDEATMTLLGALPLAVYPQAKTFANIGMGSGMTTHTVLAWPGVETVDTVEIEAAIVEGARLFGARTERFFNDPRSRLHIDDARTYFSKHQRRYDVIISEPSNPWVSGVSSLFTREFYAGIGRHLEPRGVFVQWLHIYEFNFNLLVSVLKALSAEFPYYAIYFSDKGDLILLASLDRPVPAPDPALLSASAEMRAQLDHVYINTPQDLGFRFLGDQDLYGPYIRHFQIPENSDFFPLLDINAARARFLNENVYDFLDIRLSSVPILDLLYPDSGFRGTLTSHRYYPETESAGMAYAILDALEGGKPDPGALEDAAGLRYLLDSARHCDREIDQPIWESAVFRLIRDTAVYLEPDRTERVLSAINPGCGTGRTTPVQSAWLAFYEALGKRDAAGIVDATGKLMQAGNGYGYERKLYIYTARLAGLIAIRDFQQGVALWKEYISGLFENPLTMPLELQLLLALVAPHE